MKIAVCLPHSCYEFTYLDRNSSPDKVAQDICYERKKPKSKSSHSTPAATSEISIKLMFILLDTLQNSLLPKLHFAISDELPYTTMTKIGHLLV